MKSSFQIYPPTINLWVTWIELFIVNASTATYRARTANQNATEVLIQIPNPNDRLIPKIQSDEDKIRKVKTEIEKLDYRPSSRMFGAEGQLMTHMHNERCLYRLDARKECYPDQSVRDTYLIAQSNAIFFQHVSGHFYD